MGTKTDLAKELFESAVAFSGQQPSTMAAQLLVVDGSSNGYLNKYVKYGGSGFNHVELMLMSAVYKNYQNNLKNVSNNSRIFIYCPWSPCKKCTNETIPAFMKDLGAASRNIKVKFVYQRYYTVANFPNVGTHGGAGATRWGSDNEAQTAYGQLMGQCGGIHASSPTTNNQFTVKSTPALQIKTYGGASLSTREVFDVSGF